MKQAISIEVYESMLEKTAKAKWQKLYEAGRLTSKSRSKLMPNVVRKFQGADKKSLSLLTRAEKAKFPGKLNISSDADVRGHIKREGPSNINRQMKVIPKILGLKVKAVKTGRPVQISPRLADEIGQVT